MSRFNPNNPEHLQIRYASGEDSDGTKYRYFSVEPPMVKNELIDLGGYGKKRQGDVKFSGNDAGASVFSMSVRKPEDEALKTLQEFESGLVAMRGVTEVFRVGYEVPGPDQ